MKLLDKHNLENIYLTKLKAFKRFTQFNVFLLWVKKIISIFDFIKGNLIQ